METLKKLIVSSDSLWGILVHVVLLLRFLPGINRIFQSLLYFKCLLEREKIQTFVRSLHDSHQVKSGPFEGLCYPGLESAGSMLSPKLLGSYETEIAGYFSPVYLEQFTDFVDVGCAEGYYAVGCLRLSSTLNVVCFDTDKEARQLCLGMAEANGVDDRIEVRSACRESDLLQLGGKRALIVCDCEGFEMELFSNQVVDSLASSDAIIEVHEQKGANLETLRRRFEATHSIEVVFSKTDLEKVLEYEVPDLKGRSISESVLYVAECRPVRMMWLIAQSKSSRRVSSGVDANSSADQ